MSTTPAKGEISPEVAAAASSASAGRATRAPAIAAVTAAATLPAGRVVSAESSLSCAAIARQTAGARGLARGLAPRESAGATVGLAIARMDIVRIKRADPACAGEARV